jgi:hypothetical protein
MARHTCIAKLPDRAAHGAFVVGRWENAHLPKTMIALELACYPTTGLTAYPARACVQIPIGCSNPLIVCGG